MCPVRVSRPQRKPRVVAFRPLVSILLALAVASPAVAFAQPKKRERDRPAAERNQRNTKRSRGQKSSPAKNSQKNSQPSKSNTKKVQEIDFTGLDISGRLHTPQLLYFLRRVKEELRRAALERRSFLPELYRSMEEDPL